MKAITLNQPYASLVALGVKRIETRSWPTKHRGTIAIHAAKRRPDFNVMKTLVADRNDVWGLWFAAGLVSDDGALDHLPLGAVVATANLVDCLPMIEGDAEIDIAWMPHIAPYRGVADWAHWKGPQMIENTSTGRPNWDVSSIEDQIPYGDFAPGRWAWLLADIKRLDPPAPARGYQRIWNWNETT